MSNPPLTPEAIEKVREINKQVLDPNCNCNSYEVCTPCRLAMDDIPEIATSYEALYEENKKLKKDTSTHFAAYMKACDERDQARAAVRKLREALEEIAYKWEEPLAIDPRTIAAEILASTPSYE